MPSKSLVRTDLNRLRKLCKSIAVIEKSSLVRCEPYSKEQLTRLTAERNKIYERYRPSIDSLDPTETLIFILYYLELNTQEQTAEKTNYCKSTITKKLNRIVKKIK